MNARALDIELSTRSTCGRLSCTSCKTNVSGTTAGLRSLSSKRIAHGTSCADIQRNMSTSRSDAVVRELVSCRPRRSALEKSHFAATRSKVASTSCTISGVLCPRRSPDSINAFRMAEAQSMFPLSCCISSACRRLKPTPQARTTMAVICFSPSP